MEYLLLTLTVLLGASKNILTKIVKKKSSDLYDTMKMNVITFSISLVTIFFLGIKEITTLFNVPWILMIFYAICTLGSQISLMKAVQLGSVSISTLFYSCGFLLPTIFGSLYYKEELNTLHIIGLALIILSFVISVKNDQNNEFNFLWLLAALGGLFFSGMVGIIQKLFTNEYSQYKLNNFLCVAFMHIILISAVTMLILRLRDTKKRTQKNIKRSEDEDKHAKKKAVFLKEYGFTVLLGITIALVNKINTFLSGVLPSVVAFSVINGGCILATTLLSGLVFKEKLTLSQKVGIIIGISGIVSITIGKAII